MSEILSLKQQRFVEEYIKSDNATSAYKLAGYKFKNENVAYAGAAKLIRVVKVSKAIERRRQMLAKDIVTPEFVLKGLLDMVRVDPKDMYSDDGSLKHVKDMPEHVRKAITSFDVDYRSYGKDDEAVTITTKKVKRESPKDVYFEMATMLGMKTGKGENAVTKEIIERLANIRKEAEEIAKKITNR
jgi:phage terminase small subunit